MKNEPMLVYQVSKQELEQIISDAVQKELHNALSHVHFPDIFGLHTACEFLGLTENAIKLKCNKNEIPYMKKNGRLYFSKADLIHYLKQ